MHFVGALECSAVLCRVKEDENRRSREAFHSSRGKNHCESSLYQAVHKADRLVSVIMERPERSRHRAYVQLTELSLSP